MQNKGSIVATRLEDIRPPAIQSAVPLPTFKLGLQYLFLKRITILQADDRQLTAVVEGDGHRYEQRLSLESDHLVAKCSCASTERPLCRHSIAVLLEFHRQRNQARLEARTENAFLTAPLRGEAGRMPVMNATLMQLVTLLTWLERAVTALRGDQPLPEPPTLELGELAGCALAIERLSERFQQGEAARLVLDSELALLRKQVGALAEQLQERQAVCDELTRALAKSQEIQIQIARERDQMGEHLKTLLDTLIIRKKVELDNLTVSMRDLSVNLAALTSVTPSQASEGGPER